MAPLMMAQTMTPNMRLGLFKRSRSLTSLGSSPLDAVPTMGEQLIDPFADDFSEIANHQKDPLWFEDVVRVQRLESTTSPAQMSTNIVYDCFGTPVFDLQADGQMVRTTHVETSAVDDKLFRTPEEAEKAARRARRRRSSNTSVHRSDHLSLSRHSGHGSPVSPKGRRLSLREQAFLSPTKASSGSKVKRSKSIGDGGLDKLKQDQPRAKVSRMKRSTSTGDGGISKSHHHVKSQKRLGGTRKQRSSFTGGESDLKMTMLLDQSSGSLDAHLKSQSEERGEHKNESSKLRRRSGSKRRSLTQHHSPRGSFKNSLPRNDIRVAPPKQRRRSRRSETSDATLCNRTNKRLVRSGRSLTSLTSLLSDEQFGNLHASTPNFYL